MKLYKLHRQNNMSDTSGVEDNIAPPPVVESGSEAVVASNLSREDIELGNYWKPAAAALETGDTPTGIKHLATSIISPDAMAPLRASPKAPESPTIATPDNLANRSSTISTDEMTRLGEARVVSADVQPNTPVVRPDADETATGQAAEAKLNEVNPNSREEFADLEARKDSLTPEQRARRNKMIEQQQALDSLRRRKETGIPLTDAQEARLAELETAYSKKDVDTAQAEKQITPKERAQEIKALREKKKSGELKKEDEAKLAKLEDDEIEAVANEFDPDDPESLITTAEKLQEIAESRRGIEENKQMREIFAKVFKEWVLERSNPNANLSEAERSALKKVQELVGSMHKDLLTIINANRQIAIAEKSAQEALIATKAQEKKVGRYSDISKDSEVQQQEAMKLEGMYLNLLNKRAQLMGAVNAARYANNSFRMKRFQVRRSLGLVGFWGGLIESTTIRARNTGGNALASIDSFLSGKPLAVKYANKL